MAYENFCICFSKTASESRNYARELHDYLAEQAARESIPLPMSVEIAGQDLPKLKLSPGAHSQRVIGWVSLWLQGNPLVVASAEAEDGSWVINLPTSEEKMKSPKKISDDDFIRECKI